MILKKFIFFDELCAEAKAALIAGDGVHGAFAVHGDYLAVLDDYGRAEGWTLVRRIPRKTLSVLRERLEAAGANPTEFDILDFYNDLKHCLVQ